MIDLFATPIYKSKVSTDSFEQLQSFIVDCISKIDPTKVSPYARGNSISLGGINDNLHSEEVFQPLVNEIVPHIQAYWKELTYSQYLVPVIKDMWANINYQGGKTGIHNHGTFPMSGCIYVNKPIEDMGSIFFIDPRELIISQQPYDMKNWGSICQSSVETTTGDIILFPGWLKHGVEENKTLTPRVVVGFNMMFKKL